MLYRSEIEARHRRELGMPTARTLIREAAAACRASPFIETRGNRRAEVEDLLRVVLQRPITADEHVQGAALARFRRLVARRVAGEPIEYLTGQATVRDLTLQVGPGAFIPRASSGFLADVAVERLKDRPQPIVVDVCTGVGPVALLCAAGSPAAAVYGVDISPTALAFARRNARSLGLTNVRFVRGDLFEPLPAKVRRRVDVVTAHPPYVARWEMRHVRYEMRSEPVEAITDSSRTGLILARRIVREAPAWLVPGGWLLVETVDFRAREIAAMFRKAGFGGVRHLRAKGGYDRVIAGRLPGTSDRPADGLAPGGLSFQPPSRTSIGKEDEMTAPGDPMEGVPFPVFSRNRYFVGKPLDASDFTEEQDYLLGKDQLGNRTLHGWGVVSGLEVVPGDGGSEIVIGPGLAIDGWGREIVIPTERRLEIAVGARSWVTLRIGYEETDQDPMPSPDEETPVFGTVVEGYGVWTEPDLPEPPADPGTALPNDPSVVLATLRRSSRSHLHVDTRTHRHELPSNAALLEMVRRLDERITRLLEQRPPADP